MNTLTKTALVIAFVVVLLLSLFFGAGMETGAMTRGGMMDNEIVGGLGWMWVPILIDITLAAMLLSVIFEKK